MFDPYASFFYVVTILLGCNKLFAMLVNVILRVILWCWQFALQILRQYI